MSIWRRYPAQVALCAALGAAGVHAQTATIRGDWVEPSGAVLRVAPCGGRLCVQIIAPAPGRHPSTDIHNPNPGLRSRSLCGLRIGQGFTQRDAQHAEGGRIYDPKNGRTYHGAMAVEGDHLELRGYVGLKLFGRTETWTRSHRAPVACGGR